MVCGFAPGGSGVLAQELLVEAPTDASRIEIGDTVRVTMERGQPFEAVFRGWDADLMMLRVDGVAEDWPISVFDVAVLAVRTRRTRREGFRYRAVLGAANGLFVGAGLGLILHAAGIVSGPDAPPERVVIRALQGAGFGTLGGALVGGFVGGRYPGTGWISLSLPTGTR